MCLFYSALYDPVQFYVSVVNEGHDKYSFNLTILEKLLTELMLQMIMEILNYVFQWKLLMQTTTKHSWNFIRSN